MAKQEECSKCKRAKQGGYAGEIKCSFYGRKPVFDDNPCPSFFNGKIKCPECGQEVSPSEKVCPNCGCPMKEDVTPSKNIQSEVSSNANNTTPQTPKKSGAGKVLLFVLVGIALVAGTVFVVKSFSPETQQEEESAKQEMIPVEQEEVRQEQERIAQERAKNLITTPPKSVSDLRDRIIGTRWKVEHSDGIYPVFEFDGSKVREYLMHGGNKTLNNENIYTIREDTHSDCYLIEFGDNYDLLNLKKIFMFVKGTNAVVLYEPRTGARDNLQLLN